jgi:hypothetical protein
VLRAGGGILTSTYDDMVTGLARLEVLADLAPDAREWPRWTELIAAIVHRSETYCAATGVRLSRLGDAVGGTTALVLPLNCART